MVATSYEPIEAGDDYPPWAVWARGSAKIKKMPCIGTGRRSRCKAEELEEVSAPRQSSAVAVSCLVKTAHALFADGRPIEISVS